MRNRLKNGVKKVKLSSPWFSALKRRLQGFHDADIEDFYVSTDRKEVRITIEGLFCFENAEDPYGVVQKIVLLLREARLVSERSSNEMFISHSIIEFAADRGRIKIETGYGMREVEYDDNESAAEITFAGQKRDSPGSAPR